MRSRALLSMAGAAACLWEADAFAGSPSVLRAGVPASSLSRARPLPLRASTDLKMGIFDAFKNALANDDSLGAPPPDGLSQDPWLNGMRKPIYINFVKDGETIATAEALPGDKLSDVAAKAKVSLPATAMMKANDEDVQISSSTARVPAPQRRNMVADDGSEEMMDSGLTAPVWTNLSQRGEVRTVAVSRTDYFIYI